MADRDDLYARPLHPYSRALIAAVPIPDPTEICARAEPPLADYGGGHLAACHHIDAPVPGAQVSAQRA